MKITKLKNGKYSARAYIGIVNGKRIIKRFTADTINEVKKKVLQAQLDLKEHGEIVPVRASDTLYNAFSLFISARDKVLSQTTLRAYLSIQENSFQSIMDKRLEDITSEDLQREINEMSKTLSPKTVRNKVSLFMEVYKAYCQDPKQFNFILPQKKPAENMKIPTREEVERIADFCHSDEYYSEFELPVLLGAFCGLRRGEICALEYSDIDLKNKSLRVSKSQILNTDRELEFKSPKSNAGYREVPITNRIIDLVAFRKKKKLPLISVTINQITDVFPTILKKAEVEEFRFHDLRHFFASYLLTLNVPDLYAIKLTGHSTTNMLKSVYQHTFKEEEDAIKDKILDAFNE